jgi:uncharacterized membrane protein YfbV (UPF0208 family)
MSLKAFHIIFIILAVLLAAGCAAWSYFNHAAAGFGIISAIVAVSLVVYGIWFLKKSRSIIV